MGSWRNAYWFPGHWRWVSLFLVKKYEKVEQRPVSIFGLIECKPKALRVAPSNDSWSLFFGSKSNTELAGRQVLLQQNPGPNTPLREHRGPPFVELTI